MINSDLFDPLIPIGSLMRPCIGGFEGSYSGDFSNGAAFVFTDDVLNTRDPRLGPAIRWYTKGNLLFPGSMITNMLLLWDCEAFVKDAQGRSIGIYEVDGMRVDNGQLIIEGSAYSYTEELIPGYPEKIKWPEPLTFAEVVINKPWLDQYYPNWDKRLITGLELGVPPMETLRTALYININPTTEIGTLPDDLMRP